MTEMRLATEDWAQEAIQEFREAAKWPYNAKFFYVESSDVIAIGPNRIWHMDLFNRLKRDHGPFEIDEGRRGYEGYVGGHIEFEEDGTYVCRDGSGKSLPDQLQSELNEILAGLLRRNP